MKVTVIKTENHMTYLTVEAEQADMKISMDKTNKRSEEKVEVSSDKVNAPKYAMEEKIERDNSIAEDIKEMVSTLCQKVINEQTLETEMQPIVKILQMDPLKFEMIVPLKPIVHLCNYHSMKIEPESLDIKNEDVDFVLEGLRSQFAQKNTIDRPVQEGDLITFDIEGFVSDFQFMNKINVKAKVLTDSFTNIPGLYKEIIGLRKDESKEFKLKLPEDYNIKAVANKEGMFKVKIHNIQEIVLPELNDEFANKVVPQIKTLELLKKRIKSNMEEDRVNNAQARFEYKLMDKMIQTSQIEYPPVLIDIETEGLINSYKEELQYSSQNSREYEEKIHAMAKWRILWSLVINEVAKKENIEVKVSEIDDEIEKMISEEKEEQRIYLSDEQNRKYIYELLKARKTIKKLVEIVKANT